MPFVLRQVTPVRLSRRPSSSASTGVCCDDGDDDARQVVTNRTLSACLRQLASLVSLAGDIFGQCQAEAQALNERTQQLRKRLDTVQSAVDALDSRTVEIPEGDLAVFSQHHKTNHFKSAPAVIPAAVSTHDQVPELNLLTKSNRPSTVETLYERAAPAVETPVFRPESLDASRWNDADYGRLMALGATLRRQKRRQRTTGVLDIETRRPASLSRLRDWLTDDEGVLDDLASTVGPDNINRPYCVMGNEQNEKCKLPSPEEKAKAAADQVFTAHVVRLDVTGSGFQRMTQFRRSLQHFDYQPPTPVSSSSVVGAAKKSKSANSKKRKQKRRNTIACDGDRRDIQGALMTAPASGVGASSGNERGGDKNGSRSSLRQRLNLVHLLRSSMLTTPTPSSSAAKTSSDISYEESTSLGDVTGSITLDRTSTSHASSELVVEVTSGHFVTATRTRSGALHNTISRLRRLGTDHTFNPLTAEAADGSDINGHQVEAEIHHHHPPTDVLYELIPCSEKEFGTLGNARLDALKTVKLRGSKEGTSDGGRSSSGNWSASGGSSCSTRASLAESSSNDKHHHRSPLMMHQSSRLNNNRLVVQQQQLAQQVAAAQRSLSPSDDVDSVLSGDDCSASTTTSSANGNCSSNRRVAGSDVDVDMETSSVYSCDAEGYYTSFHIDSGLKTLKEGQSEGSLQQQQQSVQQRHPSVVVENEYELFGRGSTTTTSSAGTVIYRPEAAGAPAPTARRSVASIGRRASGPPPEPPPRNSSSSTAAPTKEEGEASSSTAAAALTAAESKEIRDALDQLNAVDSTDANSRPESCSRERIRVKTQIERIPAMCVVTPPPSDDESIRSASLESHIQSTFLQHVAAAPKASVPVRVNVADLPSLIPEPQDRTPIVIRAQVVKSPTDGLVALSQLDNDAAASIAGSLSSASNSRSSSRSSSLERNNKRSGGAGGSQQQRQGARVTLDADGKVVYSSDSLRRRKAHQSHTTFESSSSSAPTSQSAFRPNPIGFANPTPQQQTKPLSPPPYRPAPSVVRTQPDGQQDVGRSSAGSPAISRSDSYRMANVTSSSSSADNNKGADANNFQRSDSYRRATAALRLGPLSPQLSAHAVVQCGRQLTTIRPVSVAAAGPIISGHLIDRPVSSSSSNLVNKNHVMNNNNRNVQYNRQLSSPAVLAMMQQQQKTAVFNPNAGGRRMYGGPRLLVNPKHLSMIHKQQQQQPASADSSINSSGGSLDQSAAVAVMNTSPMRKTPVVRPPTTPQDRPSFYNNSADSTSPLPGYQSLSPPPRLSLLPMASPFQRGDQRYHSLPTRWKPTSAAAAGDESPEEGGFLEYNNNNHQRRTAAVAGTVATAAAVASSTPIRRSSTSSSSSSSCSLDVSFTSSLNETIPAIGGSWPASPSHPATAGQMIANKQQLQQPVARSVNLVRRTTISDFKRKLLQLSPHQQQQQQRRISAVELLKATRPVPSSSSSSSPLTKNVALENLIRRSARVSYIASRLSHQQKGGVAGSSPRTDVLSSTIIEGRSEEELNEQQQTTASAGMAGGGAAVRRQLSFQQSPYQQQQQPPSSSSRSMTPSPSDGSSTPIETSL